MKKRDLTEDEKKMWDAIASSAKPIRSRKIVAAKPPASKALPKERIIAPLPQGMDDSPFERGVYAGVDRNTADRFRKGDTPIDATLDLHGLTREKAYNAFVSFLRVQYDRGSRCLLIITGKGVNKEPPVGVLRELFPKWLSQPEFKSVVLAFDVATPKHGGSGAFYVLLKRNRA